MRFRKIRFNGAAMELVYIENRPGPKGDDRTTTLTSETLPLPDFTAALQAFGPLVVSLLGLPKGWENELKVVSVGITQGQDDRQRVTVHATHDVKGTNSPWNIHTPLLRQPLEDAEEGGVGFYDEEWEQALEDLVTEAVRYINGSRQQTDLFDGAEQPEGELAGAGAES